MTATTEYLRAWHRSKPLYRTWQQMKKRCLNPNTDGYENYGGRGITVCDRWADSFAAFEADMGPRPDGATLDRIDTDGPYSPENCRWASPVEQSRNKRTNRVLTLAGESMTLVEWSERTGLSMRTIQSRLDKYGWSVDAALNTPSRRYIRRSA